MSTRLRHDYISLWYIFSNQSGSYFILFTSVSATNLGVIFESSLGFNSHVKFMSCSCYSHLRNISKLQLLELEKIIHAFFSSSLDYCNALLTGLDKWSLSRLQAIKNAAARLLTGSHNRASITPILYSLHWLPVGFRICFKILVFTYWALNTLFIPAPYKAHCCS